MKRDLPPEVKWCKRSIFVKSPLSQSTTSFWYISLILSPVKWAFKDSWYEHLMFTGNKQICWFHYLKRLVLFVCLSVCVFVLIKLVFSLHVRLKPCNEKRLGHNAVNKIRAKWKIMVRCFSLQTNSFLFSVQLKNTMIFQLRATDFNCKRILLVPMQ